MVYTKEEKKEYNRLYSLKNKEKMRLYKLKNKEKINARDRLYNQKNKEKIIEYKKLYRQTPNGKKTKTISDWKSRGLISDDYEAIYERYSNSTNCENCDCEYSIRGDGVGRWRCMDHDHITGLFRNVLCNTCNVRRG